ncbi:hypothetical protein V9K67_24550 [Paraflavisolibacter sp. H34]|uniref:hypothetical protein n=1 Tax=Huijunlia imazamoxiresistens TaxID=3127457 RepID=UPI0030194DC6
MKKNDFLLQQIQPNALEQLNDRMFEQMGRLTDPNNDLEKEIRRADALAQMGGVVINSCKAQIEVVKLVAEQRPAKNGAASGKKGAGTKLIPLKTAGGNPKTKGHGK